MNKLNFDNLQISPIAFSLRVGTDEDLTKVHPAYELVKDAWIILHACEASTLSLDEIMILLTGSYHDAIELLFDWKG